MITKRSLTLLSTAGIALAFTGAMFAAGTVAQSAAFPVLSYDVAAIDTTQPQAVADVEPAALAIAAQPVVQDVAKIDSAALDCMAKVVHHEARNQPRQGQLAVAQTLINRMKAGGRFGETVCDVANQPGQFFNTRAYSPTRDSDTWVNAVDVSRAVLRGEEDAEEAAPGAVYFRAAYSPANRFFRTRQRVATIGDHVFYR
jgi:spore germination cell wall hydrolase CwlJ-like protein